MARRDLLRQLGVGAACLPLLQASRALAAPGPGPRRLMVVMTTNGYRQTYWRPTSNGSLLDQTLPDSSSPLEPHKADVIFLPGMTNPAFRGGGHGSYPNCLAAGPNDGMREYRVPFTPTIDQLVGDALAKQANLTRSALNLGILVDQGKGPTIGAKRCFWRNRTTPVTPEADVYRTFGQLFTAGSSGNQVDQQATRRLMAHKKSILDYVGNNLQRFAGRLGTEDRMSISSHLQSVRDLEKQLQTAPSEIGRCGSDPGTPVNHLLATNYPTLVKVSMDLMVAALRCDVTRVAALATADAIGGNIDFNFVPGVPLLGTGYESPRRNWHDLGHFPVLRGEDHKRLVDKWWMGQLAALIERLKAVAEPGGTMLDSTLILWANHMEEGANHNSQRTPWLLAGSAGGYLRTGQCLASDGKPLNGVLVEICNAMGVPMESFGSPEFGGAMAGLRA
jgi:hypothetical protein